MKCKLCNSQVNPYLDSVKDYMVSQESFTLYQCPSCNVLQTEPVPDNLSIYYDSNQYLSHHTTNTNLFSFVYRNIRLININKKINILNSYAEGKTLLDIGCGTGDFLLQARKKGYTIDGVEIDNDARNTSSKKLGLTIKKTWQDITVNQDCITLWHVLEHLPTPGESLKQFHQLLNSNGTLIIAVPNYQSWDAAHYHSHWAGYDVPRHLFHFSRETIKYLAGSSGFKIIKSHPMMFDAYYVSLLSEKYKRKSLTNIPKAMYSGFKSNQAAKHSGEYSSLIYILKKL